MARVAQPSWARNIWRSSPSAGSSTTEMPSSPRSKVPGAQNTQFPEPMHVSRSIRIRRLKAAILSSGNLSCTTGEADRVGSIGSTRAPLSSRRKAHRQGRRGTEGHTVDVRIIVCVWIKPDVVQTIEDGIQRHPRLHSSQMHAQTHMDAESEPDVLLGFPEHVERVGIRIPRVV